MNHGKTRSAHNKVTAVDKLNAFLARLMGKKVKKQPNLEEIPSNNKFMFILVAMLFVLWFLTGVYYIPTGDYGLILKQGKVDKVLSGMTVGVSLPYPLAEVSIIEASSDLLSFGVESANSVKVITQDAKQLSISGKFSYLINDPSKYYLTFYQDNLNLDQRVNWLVQVILQDYFLQYSQASLLNSNHVVIGNELRERSNQVLTRYGLTLDKLNISTIKTIESSNIPIMSANNLDQSVQIIQQAHLYQLNQQQQTESLINQFKQWLAQYKTNQRTVAELLYYKTLNNIPSNLAESSYSLLNLSKTEFMQLNNTSAVNQVKLNNNATTLPHTLEREVVRQRIFESR